MIRTIATIDDGWHLYSQNLESENGPLPTIFTYEASDSCVVYGNVAEGKAKEEYDKNFGMNVRYFEKTATFTKFLVRKYGEAFTIKGNVNFMVCDDEMCLPPIDVNLEILVGKK
jgi:thiol:disulfide interchange protein DsbD